MWDLVIKKKRIEALWVQVFISEDDNSIMDNQELIQLSKNFKNKNTINKNTKRYIPATNLAAAQQKLKQPQGYLSKKWDQLVDIFSK